MSPCTDGGPLRVVLDARMAFRGGIGRYCRELANALLVDDQVSLTLLADSGDAEALGREVPGAAIEFHSAALYGFREQWRGMRRVRAGDPRTVFHFPHFNAPWNLPSNSVVTVHDLIPWSHPDIYGRLRPWVGARVLRRALRRAGRVVAVSEATRRRLCEFEPRVAAKSAVIPLAARPSFRPLGDAERAAFRERASIGRYVLHVANGKIHKQTRLLLDAWLDVRRRHPGATLVLAGGAQGEGPGIRRLPHLDDAQLARWYACAELLAQPSRDEGCGLPALEAMACGTAVVAAAIPALVELLGQAGVFVPCGDRTALSGAVAALLDRPDERRRLGLAGRARSQRLTWARTASDTLAQYRAVSG